LRYGNAFKPALVIPSYRRRFDAMSAWSKVWSDPSYRQGLGPMILPEGDAADLPSSRTDLAQLEWAGFCAAGPALQCQRRRAGDRSQDGKIRAGRASNAGRAIASSFAYAQPNLSGIADA